MISLLRHPRLTAVVSRRIVSSHEQIRIVFGGSGMRSCLPPQEVRVRPRADSRRRLCSIKLFSQERKRKPEVRLIPTAPKRSAVSEPINLPPPFTLVRLRESRDAFAYATNIAEQVVFMVEGESIRHRCQG